MLHGTGPLTTQASDMPTPYFFWALTLASPGYSLFLLPESLTPTLSPAQIGLCLHEETADLDQVREFANALVSQDGDVSCATPLSVLGSTRPNQTIRYQRVPSYPMICSDVSEFTRFGGNVAFDALEASTILHQYA